MMDAKQKGAEVELQHLEPQPMMSIRETIPIANLGEVVGERISTMWDYLHQRGVQPAGPPFVRYHTFGETETDFEFGIAVVQPSVGEDRITAGELPGGPAVTTRHAGPHEKLGDAYASIETWLSEHGREPDGSAWEVYHWIDLSQERGPVTVPVSSRWPTQLIQPIRQGVDSC